MNRDQELAEVLTDLDRNQRRLRELVGEEIDAVVLPSGSTHTLEHSQRELRRQTELLKSVMDALPANIALLDKDATIIEVNRSWRTFAAQNEIRPGYEFVGRNYFEAFPDMPEMIVAREGLRDVLEGRRGHFDFEYPCHSPHEQRWSGMSVTPTQRGAVVMHFDITDRWLASDAVRRSEEHYKTLFQANPQPAWLVEKESSRFLDVNRAALERYGYSREEFLQLSEPDIIIAQDGVTRHRLKNGEEILVEVYSHPVEYADALGDLVLAIDVTEKKLAERELLQSQRLLAMASMLSRLAAWSVELPSSTVSGSEDSRKLSVFPTGQELSLAEAFDYVRTEDRAPLREHFELCCREGKAFRQEFRCEVNGHKMWAQLAGEAVRDAEGDVVGVQGAVQDITASRRALEKLRVSEERFRLLAQATQDAIWDWDIRSDRLWWNDNLLHVFGYTPKDLASGLEAWMAKVHPQERDKLRESLRDHLSSGGLRAWFEQYRFLRADGTYAHVSNRGTVIFDPQGVAIRMVGGMSDVSRQMQAEQSLAAQAALIDQASDAIFVFAPNGRVLYWSQGAGALYGWSSEEALGRTVQSLCGTGTADQLAERKDHLQRFGEWSAELELKNRRGESLVVFARNTLLKDAFGEPESVLAIHSNVTEHKKLEAQLRRSQRLESIGTLAGGIAHDLNNVLAPIVMATELLIDRREDRESEESELLATLATSAHRGADLVRQILTFARGSEGVPRIVDLREVVADLGRFIAETFPRNITLETELGGDLWKIVADSTQIHQVMLNLCVNARDAMPEGGKLSLRLKNLDLPEGPHLLLEVEDSGSGIPIPIQEKIFEPFFTTKEPGRGTGLGLSIVFTIVRDHGGTIQLKTEPGRGSNFQVFLPAQPNASSEEKNSPQISPKGEGQLILLVDDESSIRALGKRALERHGYEVILSANGAEGISAFTANREKIAAVITDISMPVMDGLSMVKELRKMDSGVKIVGCSGRGSANPGTDLESAGFDDFVTKPYDIAKLLEVLHKVLMAPRTRHLPSEKRRQQAKTILVVDDDQTLLKLIARTLRGEGYRVLTASSAQGALEILRSGKFIDCVFSDFNLPGLHGPELETQLREHSPSSALILASGVAHQPDILLKPFTITELKTRIMSELP